MIDDAELEWMAELDWSRHGEAKFRDHVPSGLTPLAVALERLAQYAVDVWPTGDDYPHFLRCAELPPRGRWPSAGDMFDANGRPHASLHARYAAAVAEEAASLAIPLADPPSVSRAEWEKVEDALSEHWSWGEGARRVWAGLAPAFADAAANGKIMTHVRPLNGGSTNPLSPLLWHIDFDLAVRRAAACAIGLQIREDAFSPTARTTHAIFVEQVGLEPAIQAVAHQRYMSPLDLTGIGRLVRPIDDKPPSEKWMLDRLKLLMLSHDPACTSKEDLLDVLQVDFGCVLKERGYERLWKAAKAELAPGAAGLVRAYATPGPKRRKALDTV